MKQTSFDFSLSDFADGGDVYKITTVFNMSSHTLVGSVVATKFSPLPMNEAIWDLKIHVSANLMQLLFSLCL